MSESAKLHNEKYRTAKAAGLPGWGGTNRISKLPQTLEERFFAYKETPTKGKLLELGCGAGNLSIALAQKGFEVSGVDFSEVAITWAKENSKHASQNIEFQVADVTNLSSFASQTFDIVYDGNCLHCIIGDKRSTALAEWKRLLKPGGILFISSLFALQDDSAFPQEFDPSTRILTDSGLPYRFIPTEENIEKELQFAGFQILHKAVRHDSPFGHINFHAVSV